MTTAILAPWARDEVKRLGQTTFKKQILRFGHIVTDSGEFDFTPEFGQEMVDAFQAGVIETVPLMLADTDNRHTQAPDRQAGEVIGLELSQDGLTGIIRTNPQTAGMIDDNPRLGVSIRALQGRLDNDGRRWPAVLHHVLATFDPVVTGMSPWEPVQLSRDDVTKVIDLARSAGNDKEDRMPEKATDDRLSPDEVKSFRELLVKLKAKDEVKVEVDTAKATAKVQKTEDKVEDMSDKDTKAEDIVDISDEDLDLSKLTDEELELLMRQLEEDEGKSENPEPPAGEIIKEGVPVAASNTETSVVELANARLQEQAIELARVKEKLDAAEYERERDTLVRKTGLPPRIIEMARPLLEGSGHTIELANGKVDAGKVMRDVFKEVGKMCQALDLSHPAGFGMDETDDDEKALVEERKAFSARMIKEFGLRG